MVADFSIMDPNERHRGRSYVDLIRTWSNRLVSSSPDSQDGVDVLFLRGNVDYKSDETGLRYKEPGKHYDRTGNLRETIYKNTAVFIPIVTAMYSIGDTYEGQNLSDEDSLRKAVRKDISEGGDMWARYKKQGESDYKRVVSGDITKYYFETPMFTTLVARDSPLVGKFEYPLVPGNEYQSVQGGFFLLLTDLQKDKTFRFSFGGNGRGMYYTDAIYDVKVLNENSRDLTKDISDINIDIDKKGSAGVQDNLNFKKYFHLRTEIEADESSPF